MLKRIFKYEYCYVNVRPMYVRNMEKFQRRGLAKGKKAQYYMCVAVEYYNICSSERHFQKLIPNTRINVKL